MLRLRSLHRRVAHLQGVQNIRWSPSSSHLCTNSGGILSAEQQEGLLVHFCQGLRSALVEAGRQGSPSEAEAAALHEISKVYGTMPRVSTLPPFWGCLFLALAFEYELSFVVGQSPHAQEFLLRLAGRSAEEGHLQYDEAHYLADQMKRLCSPVGSVLDSLIHPPAPTTPADVSGWTLHNTSCPALPAALEELCSRGHATVDNFLGPVQSSALAVEAEGLARQMDRFVPGELEATKRSNEALRGDRITWLTGGEREVPMLAAATQYLRTRLLRDLQSSPSVAARGALFPPKSYMGQCMLSVFPAGSVGFAQHEDNLGTADDRRAISAVYYLNKTWDDAHGGHLLIGENGEEEAILPLIDRLVLFWSDSTTHAVAPSSKHAPDRLALSFWYSADTTTGEGAEVLAPLEAIG